MLVAVKESAGDPPALYVQVITGLTRPSRGSLFLLYGFLDFCPAILSSERTKQEDRMMKGYYNNSGYMGYVGGGWVLFASERDYMDYMED